MPLNYMSYALFCKMLMLSIVAHTPEVGLCDFKKYKIELAQ
jgi:hypothetical protein